MKLHPEWAVYESQLHSAPNEKDRNRAFLNSDAGTRLREDVQTSESSLAARDGYQIPIRIYQRAKSNDPSTALVIFYHSGGFTNGSLETEDLTCRHLALGGPVTVISVAYRLSPEYLYPIPMNDGWDAFVHILNNAAQYLAGQTNAARVVLSGTSSGGQLAAIVSQKASRWFADQQSIPKRPILTFAGVILRNPVTVCGMKRDYIPPQFQDCHRSWAPELETSLLERSEMGANHGIS
ncbi:hypothetical protein EYZ11_004984 [Aspergillus tanneri]|uniref:Alpha/beta hydrolase fold-3 domain-containing protein n=1 Tax=Aspergillus tanneri TaxID=1220188 RepID=A0A4S3JJ44_9EURO|nr:hypothetical protein EYZ11_004984 [Aspergillus tanneri]